MTARVPTNWDDLVGIECRDKRITLVTTTRLIEVDHRQRRIAKISGDAILDGIVTLGGTSDDLFVGLNKGEWGGGLWRIRRQDGKVFPSAENVSKNCDNALSYACNPVTAIEELPWKPGCVAIALGLIHMGLAEGGILEVCGDAAKLLHSEPLNPDDPNTLKDKSGKHVFNVPFFGLVRYEDGLMASGADGIYKIERDGSARLLPQPQFREVSGVYVSFYRPNIILVLTTINQRRSMSGAVPIFVAR